MPHYVAFDIGHKPRGKITDNYKELNKILSEHDFVCQEFFETSITEESLNPYDIFVFACPDFSKVSRQEILEIENWVRNDGGGLLLLSHAGGDKGRNSNLSELAELFGIIFENDQVLDEENNFGLENLPVISNFNPPHPITSNLQDLCYRAGCSLSVIGGAIPIANSNETSDPFSSPLICVSEQENGRICCCGSYEIFRDRIGGGIQYETHSTLALNMFKWLISDYRVELKPSTIPHIEEQQLNMSYNIQTEISETTDISLPFDTTSLDIDFDLKISNQSELMEFLKKMLKQINGMKLIIEKLIDFSSSTSSLFMEPVPKRPSQKKSPKKTPEKVTQVKKTPKKTPEKVIQVKKTPKKTKKQTLHNELHSLERKLQSMTNLLNFIKKNYSSGKMDKTTYDKQNIKLSQEIESIENRIQEVKTSLENN